MQNPRKETKTADSNQRQSGLRVLQFVCNKGVGKMSVGWHSDWISFPRTRWYVSSLRTNHCNVGEDWSSTSYVSVLSMQPSRFLPNGLSGADIWYSPSCYSNSFDSCVWTSSDRRLPQSLCTSRCSVPIAIDIHHLKGWNGFDRLG